MSGIDIEYWDTCIFLALLKGEEHRPGESRYLEEQALRFDAGALAIVTSSLTVSEILQSKVPSDAWERLKFITGRSNFQFIDVTPRVGELASEIRNYYSVNRIKSGEGKDLLLKTPDAIHVASAIVSQRVAKGPVRLLTFDDRDKPKTNDVALTRLSGMVAGKYNLQIVRPEAVRIQQTLELIGGRP